MNKIKIAIVTHQMVMGGIEKSLIELVKGLLQHNCSVTVYVERIGGELYNELKKYATVISIFNDNTSLIELILKNVVKTPNTRIVYILYSYFINKFHGDPVLSWKNTARYLDKVNTEYDYAFAYGAPVSFSVIYVDNNICAKKKYVWIHNDVSRISLDISRYRNLYTNYDKVICVSHEARKRFVQLLKEYENKTDVFYNIIDRQDILKKGSLDIPFRHYSGIKILTVGRICYEKGQDIIPDIVQKLIIKGYKVQWFCVGDGEGMPFLQKKIAELNLEKYIVLVGNQKNPYPFFRMADIYVQPSRQEGFGITISEAKIFRLPLIVTRCAASEEQITNNETGYIVPFDIEMICEKIENLINYTQVAKKFSDNLNNDSKECVSSIERLLN